MEWLKAYPALTRRYGLKTVSQSFRSVSRYRYRCFLEKA